MSQLKIQQYVLIFPNIYRQEVFKQGVFLFFLNYKMQLSVLNLI